MPGHWQIDEEANLLAGYLVGRPPDDRVRALYRSAMEKKVVLLDRKDAKLLALALKYPALVQYVDAGTAIVRRDSGLRKKLLVMFAIVECSPSHTELFLPSVLDRLNPAWVFWSGCKAVLKAALGTIIVGLA